MSEQAQAFIKKALAELWGLRESLTELNKYNKKALCLLAEASELSSGLNRPDLHAITSSMLIERHRRSKTDPQLCRNIARETRAIAEQVGDAEIKRLFRKLADDLDKGRVS